MPTFSPPVAYSRPPVLPVPHPGNRLMRHFGAQAVGQTVYKSGGVWVTKQYPSQSELDAASEVYLGGHIYEVSDDQAVALVAAGFTVDYSTDPGGYAGGYGRGY